MLVHADSGLVQRHPVLGVLLGGVGTLLFGVLAMLSYNDAVRLGAQLEPRPFSLATRAPLPTGTQWVRLVDGTWDCGQARQQLRGWPHRWFLDEVKWTQVPVTSPSGTWLVVVKLDGAASCEAAAGRPVTGILLSAATPLWDRSVARELRAALGREPDLVLLAGEDPGSSGFRCLAMLCLTGLSGVLAASSWRGWRAVRSELPHPGAQLTTA